MGYDGEIKINTTIDTKNVSSQMLSIDNQIAKTADKIDLLKQKMSAMKDSAAPTSEYKSLQNQIDKATISLDELVAKEESLTGRMQNVGAGKEYQGLTKEFDSVLKKESDVQLKIESITAKMNEMETSGTAFKQTGAGSQYSELNSQLQSAERNMDLLVQKKQEMGNNAAEKESQQAIAGISSKASFAAKVLATFPKLIRATGNGFSSLKNSAAKAFDSMKDKIKSLISSLVGMNKSGDAINKFSNRVWGLAKRVFVFSLITRAFRAMVSGIGDSFGTLTLYSSNLNAQMSAFVNSMTAFRNALVTAFQPIISTIVPMLTTLINYLTAAVNKIGMLFAAISGKTSYTEMITKNKDYAKSLDGIASSSKKATTSLAAFDDLDVMKKDSSSGGDSATATGTTEVPIDKQISDFGKQIKDAIDTGDFGSIGNAIAQKIADMLSSIPWDKIQDKAKELGTNIARLLNGVFSNMYFANELGITLAQALNTALVFAYSFLSQFDFAQYGTFIGQMLNAALVTFDWNLLADTIDAGINGAFLAVQGFLNTFNFAAFGAVIGAALEKAFTGIDWENIAETIKLGISSLNDFLKNFNMTFSFSDVMAGVTDAINNLINGMSFDKMSGELQNVWAENGTAVGASIQNFLSGIYTLVSGIDYSTLGQDIAQWFNNAFGAIDWGMVGETVKDGIVGILTALDQFIKTVNWQGVIDGIGDFFAGLDYAKIIKSLLTLIEDAVKELAELVVNNPNLAFVGLMIIAGIVAGIAFGPLGVAIVALVGMLIDKFCELLGIHSPSTVFAEFGGYIIQGLVNGLVAAWNLIAGWAEGIWAAVQAWFITVYDSVTTGWTLFWQGIYDFLATIWSLIVLGVTTYITAVQTIIQTIMTAIQTVWTLSWNTVISVGLAIWTAIKTAVETVFTGIYDTISKIMDKVEEKWSSVWGGMKDICKGIVYAIIDIINGMISALESAINFPINATNELIGKLPTSIKNTLGFSNLPTVSLGRVPYFANGGVFNGGSPFLGVLNDQPAGQTNVEAPLSTIVSAFRQVAAEMSGGTNATMEMDGETFARLIVPHIGAENTRIGVSLADGV